jgi:hypothetical protein
MGNNPINHVDPSGLLKHLIIFDGLWGEGGKLGTPPAFEEWEKWKFGIDQDQQPTQSKPLLLLYELGIKRFEYKSPNSYAAGLYSRNDTVVWYYAYWQGWEAATNFKKILKTRNLYCTYDTAMVVGYSYGGDTAWGFAAELLANGIKVNVGFTLDPRRHDKGGNNSFVNFPNKPAYRWLNFYHKTWPFDALPGNAFNNMDVQQELDGVDHWKLVTAPVVQTNFKRELNYLSAERRSPMAPARNSETDNVA